MSDSTTSSITPPLLPDSAWTLRLLEPADAEAWFAYLSVPAVVEHTSWNVGSVDELRRIIGDCTPPTAGAPFRFAVVHAMDGALAGTIGFPSRSPVNRTAEIAYDFDPSAWGRGLATLCCRAVTEWALHDLGHVRIQATTLDTNAASRRVIGKCGFGYEGTCRNLKIVHGRPRHFDLFAKTC